MLKLDQRLIVFEGLSGSGKDTVIEYVKFRLCDYPVVVEKEPTRSFYGERALVRLSKGLNDLETTMLMLLDRYDHINKMKIKLDHDSIILMNRYGLSTLVYQDESHFNLIKNFHSFLPVPSVTIVLDSDYKEWVKGNRESFSVNAKHTDSDRGNFRKELRNPQIYETYRRMYLSTKVAHITGEVKIVKGFRDLEIMTDEIVDIILRSKPATATKLSLNSELLNMALYSRESEESEKDSAKNKQVMVEIELIIHKLLSKNNFFSVDEIYKQMEGKQIARVVGNVVQKLKLNQYIESTNSIKKWESSNVVIYTKGCNFNQWEAGI